MPEKHKRFINCRIARKDGTISEGELCVLASGKIVDNFEDEVEVEIVDIQGLIIAPGYIDTQLNGAYGVDFSIITGSDEQYLAGLDKVSQEILQTGTTSILPTIITQKEELYPRLLSLLKPRSKSFSAHVLGYHAEGPFLSPAKKGTHEIKYLLEADDGIQSFEKVYGKENLSQPGVKLITVAPEVPGVLSCIKPAVERGIRISLGHTTASYNLTNQAAEEGATTVTHLFNAMSPLSHREPSVIGAVLGEKKLFYGIICDEIHVHPAAIKLAYAASPHKLILVTDAMSLMGLEDGRHEWRDGHSIVKNGLRLTLNDTGTLSGSAISMEKCVINLRKFADISLGAAIKAATWNPAQMLGLKTKGSLEIGYDADMIFLDSDGIVQSTWIMGERVWSR